MDQLATEQIEQILVAKSVDIQNCLLLSRFGGHIFVIHNHDLNNVMIQSPQVGAEFWDADFLKQPQDCGAF